MTLAEIFEFLPVSTSMLSDVGEDIMCMFSVQHGTAEQVTPTLANVLANFKWRLEVINVFLGTKVNVP